MAQFDEVFFTLLAALLVGVIECIIQVTYLVLRMIVRASSFAIGSGKQPKNSRNIVEATSGADKAYSTESQCRNKEQTCTTTPASTPSLFGNGRLPTDLLHFKGKIFKFFELPRELRDLIIDELLDHARILSDSQSPMRMTLADFVRNNFLLVNRQFRNEVQERAQKLSGFIFAGTIDRLNSYELPNVPSLVPSLRYVELRVMVCPRPDYQLRCSLTVTKRITEQMLARLSEHSSLQGIFFNIFVPLGYATRQLDGTSGSKIIGEGLSYLTKDDRVKSINVFAPRRKPELQDLQKLPPAWRAKSIPEFENLILYYKWSK